MGLSGRQWRREGDAASAGETIDGNELAEKQLTSISSCPQSPSLYFLPVPFTGQTGRKPSGMEA